MAFYANKLSVIADRVTQLRGKMDHGVYLETNGKNVFNSTKPKKKTSKNRKSEK